MVNLIEQQDVKGKDVPSTTSMAVTSSPSLMTPPSRSISSFKWLMIVAYESEISSSWPSVHIRSIYDTSQYGVRCTHPHFGVPTQVLVEEPILE